MKQIIFVVIFTLLSLALSAEVLNIYTSQQNYEFDLTEIINLTFGTNQLQVETFAMLYNIAIADIISIDFVATSGSSEDEVPNMLGVFLEQNHPNPFNPNTTIRFSLQQEEEVILEIYNVKGQMVKTLIDGRYTAGDHTINWNGKTDTQQDAPSGVYFYRLSAGAVFRTKKMILLK